MTYRKNDADEYKFCDEGDNCVNPEQGNLTAKDYHFSHMKKDGYTYRRRKCRLCCYWHRKSKKRPPSPKFVYNDISQIALCIMWDREHINKHFDNLKRG